MRRVHQTGALLFLAFSIWVIVESRKLNYFTELGPGPGFFPFWVAMLLGALSVTWFGQVSLRSGASAEDGFTPDRTAIVRIASIVVAIFVFSLVVDAVGFRLTMFGFLLLLLLALGRQNPILTLLVSLLGSFGLFFVFKNWLGVQLPVASIDFLRALGL